MTRRQLLFLLAALVVLVAAGAAVMMGKREDWRADDPRVGRRLVPDLVIAEVARIHIKDAQQETHLERDGEGQWRVRERKGYPAHIERIGDFLTKLAGLTIAQVEPMGESQRPRLDLVEPDKPQAKNTGIRLELAGKEGKSLGRLLAGKKVVRQTQATAPEKGTPQASGRYVLGADASAVWVISDPLDKLEADPAPWLARDLIRVQGAKTMTSLAADGTPRWRVTRESESANWRLADGSQKLEDSRVQDIVAVLIYIALADVATDPAQGGFDKGVTLRIDTFHNTHYTLQLGGIKKDPQGDLRYLKISLVGDPPAKRIPPAKETQEEKAKKDQEFEENYKGQLDQLAREGRLKDWTFLVKNADVEALLRDRAQLLPAAKPADGKGK